MNNAVFNNKVIKFNKTKVLITLGLLIAVSVGLYFILSNHPKNYYVISGKGDFMDSFPASGQQVEFSLENGSSFMIKSPASYEIVLTPGNMVLAKGQTDSFGNVKTTYKLPKKLAARKYVVHVYTTNILDKDIDIQQNIAIGMLEGQ